MSSKKVLRATVSYVELFNRCPPEQLKNLKIVKEKNRIYKEKLQQLPEELPKINWEYYKQKVRKEFVPLVEEFEKKYNGYKVPYPEDPYTPQIEEMKKKVIEEVNAYKEKSNERIEQLENEIIIKCCEIPYEEMTMEEFCIYYPDIAPDFINRPTFWPHTPEEQIPGPSQPEYVKITCQEQQKIEDEFGIYERDKKQIQDIKVNENDDKDNELRKGNNNNKIEKAQMTEVQQKSTQVAQESQENSSERIKDENKEKTQEDKTNRT